MQNIDHFDRDALDLLVFAQAGRPRRRARAFPRVEEGLVGVEEDVALRVAIARACTPVSCRARIGLKKSKL